MQACMPFRVGASGAAFAAVEALALEALYQELACYPKPGLVSFIDAGSHTDMSAETFQRSIAALQGYFAEMAAAGADACSFRELNALGREAERCMYEATGGRNTHRGAVFSLGLLCAAAGWTVSRGRGTAEEICKTVSRLWGEDILRRREVAHAVSHGDLVRHRYAAPGAREEAAAGFPTVAGQGLPALRAGERCGLGKNAAALQALFAIMAVLEDNNLLYRGGREALAFARRAAGDFLLAGGMRAPGGYVRALALHRRFVEARLSPGGAADLLAATLFVAACEKRGPGPWD